MSREGGKAEALDSLDAMLGEGAYAEVDEEEAGSETGDNIVNIESFMAEANRLM